MKKLLVGLMLLGLCGGVAQAADSSNGNDIGKVCTGFLYVTPKANDAQAKYWYNTRIQSLMADQNNIFIGKNVTMTAGTTTELKLKFAQEDLDKNLTISGLGPKNNPVSTELTTLRELSQAGYVKITGNSCLSSTEPLLQSQLNSTQNPLPMVCPNCMIQ